jgi:hypothetical protein
VPTRGFGSIEEPTASQCGELLPEFGDLPSALLATAGGIPVAIAQWPSRAQSNAMIELRMVTAILGGRVMRNSFSVADRYRGAHGPDLNSAGSLRAGAPPPRRSGQLDDYYPVIAQAVNRLEQSTAGTRQAIYDRARAAMIAQLRGLMPSLSESDINREQLALDRSIRKVETESLRRSCTSPQPSSWQADPPPESVRTTGDEQTGMSTAGRLPRYATRPRSSTVILHEDPAGNGVAFADRLAIDKPDLFAELEVLQKEIRRGRRSSLTMLTARKLVPLTVIGLLVLSVANSGAY